MPSDWSYWFSKLKDLHTLEKGWDSYGADPPDPRAIGAAEEFLILMREQVLLPSRVEPSAMGGVGITCKQGSWMAYVEFYNQRNPTETPGLAWVMLCDDTSREEPTVFQLPLDTAGQLGVVGQIKNFLEAAKVREEMPFLCPPSAVQAQLSMLWPGGGAPSNVDLSADLALRLHTCESEKVPEKLELQVVVDGITQRLIYVLDN